MQGRPFSRCRIELFFDFFYVACSHTLHQTPPCKSEGMLFMKLPLAILAVIFALAAAAHAVDRPIAIVHGRIINGLGGPPIEDGTVILRGRRIEYAGTARGAVVPKDARILDARGKSVLPGLADMHVHLQGGWDGISVDLLGYQRYFNSMLYAGITTLLDTGNYQPWILQLRQEQANGHLLAPRIYCVGAMIDAAEPAWPDLAYAVASPSMIPAVMERDKRAGVDLIKGYRNLSDAFLISLTREAGKAGLRVIIDQWERNGSPDLVRTGIAGFAHAPTRKMSAGDLELIRDRDVFVITTLVVEEYSGHRRLADLGFLNEPLIRDTTPPWFLSELRSQTQRPLSDSEKAEIDRSAAGFDEMKRNVKKLHDLGVLLAAGTDAPYPGVFQGESLHHELELLVESGLTPLEALRLATFNAARIMKADAEWGSLQAGRLANVLIVDGNPAEHISDTRKVETVILQGNVLDRSSLSFPHAHDPGFLAVPGNFVP
jgi:Amidohydrolase family